MQLISETECCSFISNGFIYYSRPFMMDYHEYPSGGLVNKTDFCAMLLTFQLEYDVNWESIRPEIRTKIHWIMLAVILLLDYRIYYMS